MQITRAITASVVLAALLAGQSVHAAQSVTVTDGVTVIRGIDDPQAAKDRSVTRERAGVTVFRGSETPYVPEPPMQAAPSQPIFSSGENLWIYDPESGAVVACYLRTTVYGDQVVRCASE